MIRHKSVAYLFLVPLLERRDKACTFLVGIIALGLILVAVLLLKD